MINKLYKNLKKNYQNCNLCTLCEERTQVVFGKGNLNSEIVFIGEAPGAEEDKIGEPFVGRSGKLLTEALENAGIKREEVYITNINKCRPPNNRPPKPEEVKKCKKILNQELEIIKPKIVCLVGATSVKSFLNKKNIKMGDIRGKVLNIENIKVFPVFHPAYVLRGMKTRKPIFFEDIKRLSILIKNL